MVPSRSPTNNTLVAGRADESIIRPYRSLGPAIYAGSSGARGSLRIYLWAYDNLGGLVAAPQGDFKDNRAASGSGRWRRQFHWNARNSKIRFLDWLRAPFGNRHYDWNALRAIANRVRYLVIVFSRGHVHPSASIA